MRVCADMLVKADQRDIARNKWRISLRRIPQQMSLFKSIILLLS